ncbi:MAG TPA: hypothetical protein VMM76_25250 [Pirellulaceae bacterium]|nr:hypothetical protein [Pirellulaceae bacterium]
MASITAEIYMTIANCPRCREQVSVPEDASREATVRCPLCQEEYSIIEALAQLPPTLIIVADVGLTPAPVMADGEDSAWSAFDLDGDDTDEVAVDSGDAMTSAAAFDFASGPTTASTEPKAAIRSSSRPRKPKGNPIKSVLSIVIGGLMAFPIAQLILWYLPGDLKRDFGAGPIVAQYFPAIVPAKFRGSTANAESNSARSLQGSEVADSDFNFGDTNKFATSASNSNDNANPSTEPARNRKKKQKVDSEVPISEQAPDEEQMTLDDSAAAGAGVFDSPLEVPGLELGGLPLLDEPASPAKPADSSIEPVEALALEPPPLGDVPLAAEAPKPEVAGLAPGKIRNAPQVSADHVVESFQAALSGNSAWDANEASSPSVTLKREFYQSFSTLGEALTFADRSDEQVSTQIAETTKLLHEIATRADKLAVINRVVANGWIKASYETRKTNGICLYGVVKSVEPIGNFFETTVESGDQQIAVVSLEDPSESIAEGRQVLVLGTILDNPAKNLGGYEGSREVVIVDGVHVHVAAE